MPRNQENEGYATSTFIQKGRAKRAPYCFRKAFFKRRKASPHGSKIYNRRLWRIKGINFGEAVLNFKPCEQRRKNLADSERGAEALRRRGD